MLLPSLSRSADAGCCGCSQGGGEGNAPAAAERRAPRGPLRHSLPVPGRGTGGARELTKFWGEVVAGGGTREPARALLTPKLEGTCSVRGQRRAGPAPTRASPAPPSSSLAPQISGRGRTRELRSERGCWGALDRPGLDRPPALTAAECRGPIGPGITRARADEGMRASGQGPQRRRRGWATRDGSAVTFRDPQPRQAAGGARALRGPDPRGPARAHQAGPLLAGARRSQHMVGGGAPPRPAETGCSRSRMTQKNSKLCSRANVYTQVPDGGWGWAVAISFFFVEVFTYGIIKSFGVFFNDLMDSFDESNSTISWIISICVFVLTFTAPLSTVLSNRFGHRLVVMAGGLLISTGMVAASFSQRVYHMYISIGVISGLGYCFSFLPTVTILSQYFDKRRSVVTAVASTGECFAVFAFAPAITALKEHIGWRYSLLFVGLLQLNIMVCGALLRPITIQGPGSPKTTTHEPRREVQCMLENEKTRTSIDSIDSGVELTTSPKNVPSQANTEQEARAEQQQTLVAGPNHSQKRAPLLDFSILKERSFICYSLFGLFATLGFFAPPLYIIPLGISLGIDRDRAAFLLSTMAIAEVFGRIGAGFVLNREPIRKIYIELICVILLTVSLFAFTFATEFWGLMLCSVFFGVMVGTIGGTHIPLLAEDDVVGIEKMSSAAGVYVFIQSISGLAGPPLAGLLVDQSKIYSRAFYSCAAGMSVAAVCLALVRPCKKGLCQHPHSGEKQTDSHHRKALQDIPEDFLEMDLGKCEHRVHMKMDPV